MANGTQKSREKVSVSTSKIKNKSVKPQQSQERKTKSPSSLSRDFQASLSESNQRNPMANLKQQQEHGNISEQQQATDPRMRSTSDVARSGGKKRDNQGLVKEQGKRKVSGKPPPGIDPVAKPALEKEVYALGGNAEDFSLVANLDSESELDDNQARDSSFGKTEFPNGLRKGIGDILKQIDEYGRHLSIESEAEEEEEVEEDDGKEDGSNGSSCTTPLAGIQVASKSGSDKSGLLIPARSDWFNTQLPTIERSESSNSRVLPRYIHHLYEHAKSLLDTENEAFKTSQKSSSSHRFYSTIIASGTLSDKISALTLAVQESPLHNVRALETLISLGKKRSRAQAVDVLRALKDLFAQGSLLPSDRKLLAFSAHPSLLDALATSKYWKPGDALPGSLQPEHLILWAYESWLKEKYFEVLKTLEVWCNDEIEFSKSRAITFVYELLKERPEQEANLLRLLTNKLGDPAKKIASQTSYLLMQLMAVHPLMKMTIISSIESELLFRPRQSLYAKYYAAITLNQTVLSSKEEGVASKLLSIYFSLFVGLLKPANDDQHTYKDECGTGNSSGSRRNSSGRHLSNEPENMQAGDLRDKLTSAILTGINRAYPYTESSGQSLSTHLETLFQITHSSNFNTSIQAMMLIQQLCSSHQASAERFYRTLYGSLLDGRLITSSKQSLYLNLLYRALKEDTNLKRVKAFTKRILQMLALHQPPFICGCFFLLQELSQTFPALGALIDQPEEDDVDGEIYEDVREAAEETPLPTKSPTIPNQSHAYDSRKRDPEHSNAENSCLWEVVPFLAHFHPSVSVGAEHIIRHARLPGKPDLELHTLIHFLDRFAYRNAKIGASKLRGSSIMQPLAGSDKADLLVSSASQGQLPVNSEKFWGKESKNVPAEDVFFHQYFNMHGKTTEDRRPNKKMKKSRDDGSEDEESEIWKAMMESAPDVEGEEESDQGLEMSELESDFEESLEEAGDDEETDDDGVSLFSDGSADRVDAASDHGNSESVVSEGVIQGRRRKLKMLPTFAAASDYVNMIDNEEGEDVG